MMNVRTHITINKKCKFVFPFFFLILMEILCGCKKAGNDPISNSMNEEIPTVVPTCTPVLDENFVEIFKVTEIDGAYYEFLKYSNQGIITHEEEENVIPQFQYLGTTTRAVSDYPKNNFESNCLPDKTEIFYNEINGEYALFFDENPGYWWHSDVYKVYDKNEMVLGKHFHSFEYTEALAYSKGWIEKEYNKLEKNCGFICEADGEKLVIQKGIVENGKVILTEEYQTYSYFMPDLYIPKVDNDFLYCKKHIMPGRVQEEVRDEEPYYFIIDDNGLVAIIAFKNGSSCDIFSDVCIANIDSIDMRQ